MVEGAFGTVSYTHLKAMKDSIARQFIDDLLTKSNIVDVINARVKLKKAGRDYQACCPFHHEKTPSFTVSEKKQFYYCFGCGAKGNAISFLMDYDKLEFVEAVEELAASAGLEVPYEKRPNQFGLSLIHIFLPYRRFHFDTTVQIRRFLY